ncbi:Potassium transporter 23 [Tetrabaena socialis]|uniref:Potassium transporter 23 n=1 Tax=Tetrabaena socialis TaxID=47790 RepID=A0A2J7ZXM6_9CHLO|nr:Potassium transporter 23 [Tetrabaena socialis]|eukprot:PNH05018.1 Potassium transporter 23 [Tetrabaena socialis]
MPAAAVQTGVVVRPSVTLPRVALWGVAVMATASLMGDGVLTPSISVLSAVSGLTVAVPDLGQDVIIGVTIGILFLVFAIQPLGTGKVGLINAPVVALWLLANLAININTIVHYGGEVFEAINPAHIVTYFARNGAAGWRSLGAVMLSITGVEALYADLGHLSRGSISAATGLLAYPCLTITYFGQAAWIMHNPADTDVFWKSMPRPVLYPMLVLATLATMIASQALISAIFSTAIHGVCVFLSVRRLALPSVPRRRRLHVYTSRNATAPNFYHVVSSYGYLDVIDHGPAFLTELLDAVLRRLKAAAAARRRQATGGGGGGGGDDGDGGEYAARAESHHGGDQPRDVQHGQLVVRSLSHGGASSGGVGADSKGKSSVGSGGAGGGGGDGGGDGGGGGGAAPGGAAEGADGLLAAVETAAADFLEAQLHGVVYYASRAILRDPAARPRGSSLSRSRPGAGPLGAVWKGLASFYNWLLFGVLFRWLAALAFVDMESWRVPPERLVELGMAVEM